MTSTTMFCRTCNEDHERWDWHSRGMLCARCEQHTGNNHQGHYWKFCQKTRLVLDEFHFCCPTLPCDGGYDDMGCYTDREGT